MSFKKALAMLLVLFIGVNVLPVATAQAKDADVQTEASAEEAQKEEAPIASFSMADVIAGIQDNDLITISENQTPLAAVNQSLLSKDEAESLELAKKEADEAKEQQKKAEKKAKKEYERNLRLLATIIYCEAGGQCYAGRLAVGAVVMNRVNSSYYPNTVKGVIWQPYQFGPVRQGKMARELRYYDKGLYKYPERSGSLKAAKDILAGKYIVKYNGKTINLKKYTNFNGHLSNAKIRISGHDFA